ncbi:uncharacterized protein N7479_008190 [Penicillium vulpinum]|uniref:uncharacterized protein n=1 Tax=Penicillium vulpinum TaxID=29845 RepID=UPI002547A5C0|nr:uncharacterized protein N7479_008190 [Penicillium vulpinum]KAJ5961040.1 hypothetical protein N7479_008190 [Penicillium vulpinum]
MPFAVTGRLAQFAWHLAAKFHSVLGLERENMRAIVAQSANVPVTKGTLVLSVLFKTPNAHTFRRSRDIRKYLRAE